MQLTLCNWSQRGVGIRFKIVVTETEKRENPIDEKRLRELETVIVELRDLDAKKFVDVALVGQSEVLTTSLH